MNMDRQGSKQEACFTRACHVWHVVNHNTNVTYMSNEFDVEANCTPGKCVWQLSIKFCVVHAAMNGWKIVKIH